MPAKIALDRNFITMIPNAPTPSSSVLAGQPPRFLGGAGLPP
jgi:hypothetical protein